MASCANVKVKDAVVCQVAGITTAGGDCGTMLSGQKYAISFEQLIEMLEPNETRGGAVIIPIDDFVNLKTALESLCQHVRCNKELKKNINKISNNLNFIKE